MKPIDTTASTRANARKVHDNRAVSAFLAGFDSVAELFAEVPDALDILTGVAWLKSAGHTATRPLSRKVLFQVLAYCPELTTDAVAVATFGVYSRTQVERYAAHARVASKALASQLPHTVADAVSNAEARRILDAPYLADLALALAAGHGDSIPHLVKENGLGLTVGARSSIPHLVKEEEEEAQ